MTSIEKTKIMDDDLPYWAAFSYCRNLGSVRLRKVASAFPSLKDAWEAPLAEFHSLGFEEGVLGEIDARRKELDPLSVWERVEKEGLTLVPITHPDYPPLLHEIFAPPSFLYARGALAPSKDEIAIAVVGTRRITPYGEQATEMLVRPLAKNGCTIVSGLAYGVDARAHEITLEERGRTVAVLGCGLDRASVYPNHHRYLADKIADEGGCVVSEHAPGTPPLKHHFPYRNRIIAGLARATLVIEAPEGSGALTTAAHALEFNRDVMAVPGNITSPNAVGANMLLKKGAIPVTCAEDIFSALNLSEVKATLDIKQKLPDTEEESKMFEALTLDDPIHIDVLAQQTALAPPAAASTLAMLELKGMVKNVGGMRYIKLM
ncbi:MAG: DNA-processing protein DprA [Patescibacteria group bacterium]